MSSVHLAVVHGEGGGTPGGRSAPRRAGTVGAQRLRIVDGALTCIARQGIAKTTVDDVARAAGCSRATVYRVFPGGKDEVLAAAAETEVARFFSSLAVDIGAADDVEAVLVTAIVEAATAVAAHRPLAYLLEHEPELVLPHLAFGRMDGLLRQVATFAAPFLGRFMGHDEADRVAEWTTRVVLSYLVCPADGVELTDPASVRRLVRLFLLPAVAALRGGAEAAGPCAVVPETPTRRKLS